MSYLSIGLLSCVLCLVLLGRPALHALIPGRLAAAGVARVGGLAMMLGLAVAGGLAAFVPVGTSGAPAAGILPALAGIALIFLVGLADDVHPLSPPAKLAGQTAAAGVAWLLGLQAGFISDPAVNCAFTVFCLVGGANAFNLIDGVDGLAGGVALIAGATIFFMARNGGNVEAAVLAAALTGAAVGLFWFNLPPARVFMGDSGSNLLGFGLVAVTIHMSGSAGGFADFSAGIAVLAVPIVETATTIGRRLIHGQSPLKGDLNHIHHRLLRQGLPVGAVLGLFFGATLVIGGVVLFGGDLATEPLDLTLRSWSAVGVLLLAGSLFVYLHTRLAPAPGKRGR